MKTFPFKSWVVLILLHFTGSLWVKKKKKKRKRRATLIKKTLIKKKVIVFGKVWTVYLWARRLTSVAVPSAVALNLNAVTL